MRRSTIVILVLLAISILFIVVDQVAGFGAVKKALAWLLAPLQRGLNDGASQAGSLWDRWQQCGDLQEENKDLQELVDYLTRENRRYQEVKRQNEEFRQLLGLQGRFPDLDIIIAEVIGRYPEGERQTLRVGWASYPEREVRVKVGMPVISPAGLVGRIIEVYPNAADVLLITDISSSVSAVVQNDDRPTGVVDGQWQAGRRLLMRYLPQGSVVNEGDWVVTSGLQLPPFEESAFPQGIPIGRVLHVETGSDLHQQAELIPLVDFDHLEWVEIVVGTR